VTGQERDGLLLAARLLESGLPVEDPAIEAREGGHVAIAIALAGRLGRVVEGRPERVREIVASLRAAAEEAPAA
jgi:hypothetical protein